MKWGVLSTIVLLCGFNSASVLAEEFQILGVEEPPSTYRNIDGQPMGLTVDIVRAIQEHLDNHDPIQILPEVHALDIATTTF